MLLSMTIKIRYDIPMKKKSKIEVSVIIPVRVITEYVRETVKEIEKQSYKNFEVIIVNDKKEKLKGVTIISSKEPTPAYKRNLGSYKARGKILAFLDDDSFPDKNWLRSSLKVFSEYNSKGDKSVVGVCGPCLTPKSDNIYQKASGWVLSSGLGSGGAGVFRNRIMPRRFVDDYPSVNLLVKKDIFNKVGGFDIKHWPGEDTKLCMEIINSGGKIVYDPSVLVYHHRRPVLLPHLKQISRYAERRGYFARHFPKTSFRLGYFSPSLFVYGIMVNLFLSLFYPFYLNLLILLAFLYLLGLFFTGVQVAIKEKNLYLAILVMISIYFTHFTYGLLFLIGYLEKEIITLPHRLDSEKNKYIGG